MIQSALDLRSPEELRDAGIEAVEEWRPVVGLEGVYEVSSFGRIRTVARPSSGGRVVSRLKVVSRNPRGYASTTLYLNNKSINGVVHVRVAAAFIGPRPPGLVINHKNGDRMDARPCNLEYVTQRRNIEHSYELGLAPRGSRRAYAKLNEEKAREILRRALAGEGRKKLGKEFGVTGWVVYEIIKGLAWSHATGVVRGQRAAFRRAA